MQERGSGVLCHITSLPSGYGIGDLGPEAYVFIDFLVASRQKHWQILPLNPTDLRSDNSPYHSYSAFAFNPLLISPDLLIEDGLLDRSDLEPVPDFSNERVEFEKVISFKKKILFLAYKRFKGGADTQDFENFCAEHALWLDDYALFMVMKSRFHGIPWNKWPSEFKNRRPEALRSVQTRYHDEVQREFFCQYVFRKQWSRLKNYCNQQGIQITGDMPIYVVHDSVDPWTHPELFQLDENGAPSVVAGVPPDYFSETGQLWGNPLYQWRRMKETNFEWWVNRVAHNLLLFDRVRIDHFRGFVGYWEIQAKEKTAIKGRWVKAPATDFFNRLKQRFRSLPIIAEDLGTITPDVKEIMSLFAFPGMKVLLFAFGEDDPDHPYLPHTYEKNCIVYTGTHDNNTVRGWFLKEAGPEEKRRLFRCIGRTVTEENIHWEFIRLGAMSVANTFIVPMQDVLGLGEESRMNRPATNKGNWCWRLLKHKLTPDLAEKFARITETCGRA
jgi:4-alpha-glucanotransferase